MVRVKAPLLFVGISQPYPEAVYNHLSVFEHEGNVVHLLLQLVIDPDVWCGVVCMVVMWWCGGVMV